MPCREIFFYLTNGFTAFQVAVSFPPLYRIRVFYKIESTASPQNQGSLRPYRTNHFGYGTNNSISWKISELIEIAVLATLSVYLLKKELKKQCFIMKNCCTIPFFQLTAFQTIVSILRNFNRKYL